MHRPYLDPDFNKPTVKKTFLRKLDIKELLILLGKEIILW